MNAENQIVVYQPNEVTRLDVRVEGETIWLTQSQIADLFGTKRPAITKHLGNIFKSGELNPNSVSSILEHTAADGKVYKTQFYNLDAILSVGYRVNSLNATRFRIWATGVLKRYLLDGYVVNKEIKQLSKRVDAIELKLASEIPPAEKLFFDGEVFDAYTFISSRIREARKRIILIDNYVNDTVLTQLDKRRTGVSAQIFTGHVTKQLQLDVARHNEQYPPIAIAHRAKVHDRFLIIDSTVYLLGASVKDAGRKLTAVMRMSIDPDLILHHQVQPKEPQK